MKEFVEYVVKNLVDYPEEIKVSEIGNENNLIMEVRLNKSDFGKVIGKKGKNIDAIRTLLHSIASKNHMRVTLQIVE